MEIIQFDIKGKFAHFRKYYGNNTAMSFSIPPRTTAMGMLAAILGLPKDSYYELLSSENIRIGIAVKSTLKKNFHRLNFLSVKSIGDMKKSFDSDLRGRNGRIQTPFEVVTGADLRADWVVYRLFVSAHAGGQAILEELKERLLDRASHFQLSMGVAQFQAGIENVQVYPPEAVREHTVKDCPVAFHSAVLTEQVRELDLTAEENLHFVEEELLPADFKENGNRELKKMNRVLFNHRNIPLRVIFSGTYYAVTQGDQTQHIQFLE